MGGLGVVGYSKTISYAKDGFLCGDCKRVYEDLVPKLRLSAEAIW